MSSLHHKPRRSANRRGWGHCGDGKENFWVLFHASSKFSGIRALFSADTRWGRVPRARLPRSLRGDGRGVPAAPAKRLAAAAGAPAAPIPGDRRLCRRDVLRRHPRLERFGLVLAPILVGSLVSAAGPAETGTAKARAKTAEHGRRDSQNCAERQKPLDCGLVARFGAIAQLVARFLRMEEVGGSTPPSSTRAWRNGRRASFRC